jgi:hypothetical protein
MAVAPHRRVRQYGSEYGRAEAAAPPKICGRLRDPACEQDLSHDLPDASLPAASGKEPFIVIGAIAGG